MSSSFDKVLLSTKYSQIVRTRALSQDVVENNEYNELIISCYHCCNVPGLLYS